MPYGSITDGVWRSKFKVEWRRHLIANPSVAEARRLFQASSIGQLLKNSSEVTIAPIMLLDRYLIYPSLVVSNRVLARILQSFQQLEFIDSVWLRRRKSSPSIPRLVMKPPPSPAAEMIREPNVLALAAQQGYFRSRFNGLLWRVRFLGFPTITWSVVHARILLKVYEKLGVNGYSIADLVDVTRDQFLPKLLDCINGCDQPANRYWLDTHAAQHVISLLQGFKSVSAELYGKNHTDNIIYERIPISVLYNSAYVRPDVAKGSIQKCLHINHLPSVIVDAVLRSYSDNSADSPVASGPKTISLTLAICLLPNSHHKDALPLFIQDAMMTGIDQLRV